MEAKELINFNKLNQFLGRKGNTIRKDRIPKKHAKAIEELEAHIQYWMDRNKTS